MREMFAVFICLFFAKARQKVEGMLNALQKFLTQHLRKRGDVKPIRLGYLNPNFSEALFVVRSI